MRRLDHFWAALEAVPGLALLQCEWDELTGPDSEIAQRFLRPTSERAKSYPCPRPSGDGCPRRVIEHAPDDIVAVCGNSPQECDSVALCAQDIVIHELNLRTLVHEVVKELGISPHPSLDTVGLGLWSVGTHRENGGADLPVYLSIQLTEADFRNSVTQLLAGTSGPCILVAPTTRRLDAKSVELLRGRQCPFFALGDLVAADDRGSLRVTSPLGAKLAAARAPVGPPEHLFKQVGGGWTIRFAGGDGVPFGNNLKGLPYLAVLLKNPGREFEPWEIANEAGDSQLPPIPAAAPRRSDLDLEKEGLFRHHEVQFGAFPDSKTLSQCRHRLREIEDELLPAAKAHSDLSKSGDLLKEREDLLAYLSARPRVAGPQKKERDRVVSAINYALSKIEGKVPELGTHLGTALEKGPRWRYRKELAVTWEF